MCGTWTQSHLKTTIIDLTQKEKDRQKQNWMSNKMYKREVQAASARIPKFVVRLKSVGRLQWQTHQFQQSSPTCSNLARRLVVCRHAWWSSPIRSLDRRHHGEAGGQTIGGAEADVAGGQTIDARCTVCLVK